VVTSIVTVAVTLLTAKPRPEQLDGLTWESDFRAKLGEILEQRAVKNGMKTGDVPKPIIRRPPWYLNIKYWATAILLSQVALLLFFG
jgi:hypothetical protein